MNKKWTIMTYLAGDNNLSSEMAYGLAQIRNAAETISLKTSLKTENNAAPSNADAFSPEIALLAYYDSGVPMTPTKYYDFTDEPHTRGINAEEAEASQDYLNSLKPKLEDDSAEALVGNEIVKFVDWCVRGQKREAENYILILSGHGGSLFGTTFLRDEDPLRFMTIEELKQTLKEINNILGKKIGILGFDSCVMSMVEIGYEIKEYAEIVIASEGSIPDAGWNYGNILNRIQDNETHSNREAVAETFVREFINLQKDYAIGGRSVDISAWDLNAISDVTLQVNKLGKHLYNVLLPLSSVDKNSEALNAMPVEVSIGESIKKSILTAHWNCQTYMFEQNVDIKDFCHQLKFDLINLKFHTDILLGGKEPVLPEESRPSATKSSSVKDKFLERIEEITGQCEHVIASVDNCVFLCGYSGAENQYSYGISLFFPWSRIAYELIRKPYEELSFTKSPTKKEIDKGWNDFLQIFLLLTRRKNRKDDLISHLRENLLFLSGDKLNLPYSKLNLPYSKGDITSFLNYFGSFKNFPDNWQDFGFSDENDSDTGETLFDYVKE